MQQIKPGIFIEQTYLGVTLGALVYPHGTIYIDAPLRAEDARAWRAALLGQRSGANRLLITLDSHIDRTLGAKAFDCPIMAHENTAQVSRNRPSVFKGQSADNGSDWEGYVDSIGTRWAIPDITFSHQVTLHWGGPEVIVEHHPGPTPGSLWVIIPKEEVIFIGDAVVVNQPPFLANAELPAWLENLAVLIHQYKSYQIISSRSGIVTLDDARHQHAFLKDLSKRLERLSQKSATPQATEKMIPALLSHFEFSKDKEEQYYKRLQAGLYEYFARQAQPASELEDSYPVSGEAG